MFNRTFRRFSLLSLCLIALLGVPAEAQGNREGSSANSAQARKPFAFEVVSIRPHRLGTDPLNTQYMPDGYKATFTLRSAIMQAYVPDPHKWLSSKVLNAPAWVDDWYDIDARVAPEDAAAWQQAQDGYHLDSVLLHSAWQAVLRERCNLALHITPVEIPYLDLMVDKHGAKLNDKVPAAIKPEGLIGNRLGSGYYFDDNGMRHFIGVTMDDLAALLMRLDQDFPIQNKTGLTGRYNFNLPWYDARNYPASEIPDPLDRMPLTSIGLMLKRGKGPAFIINIDHIEKPSPN
jgi:uncharacterized protein (TIGR03435 family)